MKFTIEGQIKGVYMWSRNVWVEILSGDKTARLIGILFDEIRLIPNYRHYSDFRLTVEKPEKPSVFDISIFKTT